MIYWMCADNRICVVFEYRFTAPSATGELRTWWIMWDYHNGLVRVHDYFDCCKPGKVFLLLLMYLRVIS